MPVMAPQDLQTVQGHVHNCLKDFFNTNPGFSTGRITSSASQPNKSTMSSVTSSGLALGKSTLLSTE